MADEEEMVELSAEESEGAAEERKEPSQEPSNALGEREISEAATSRDGDGGTVFI